jgi:hypothetical protein
LKNKKYHTVGTFSKSNIKIVGRSKTILLTLSWLGMVTWYGHLNKRGGVKLLFGPIFPLNEIMRSCKLFPHVSKMPILTDKRANSVTVNNVMILSITHNIFNLDDTEVFIYIRSVIIKRVDSPTII